MIAVPFVVVLKLALRTVLVAIWTTARLLVQTYALMSYNSFSIGSNVGNAICVD